MVLPSPVRLFEPFKSLQLPSTLAPLLKLLERAAGDGSTNPFLSSHVETGFGGLVANLLPRILPLFIAQPSLVLPLLKSLLEQCIKQILSSQATSRSKQFSTASRRVDLEISCLVESVLRLIKDFLLPDSDERSRKNGVVLTVHHKELLGKECFEILGELLALESDRGALGRVNMMSRRIILDIFEYSTSSCPSNKQLLVGDNVLRGGDTLGQILFDAADVGLTERALELSFRLSDYISRLTTINSKSKTPKTDKEKREVKLQEDKRKKTKSEWEKNLFSTKLYARALEKKRLLDLWKELSMRNFEEKSVAFLQKLAERHSSCFKQSRVLSLSANSRVFGNISSDASGAFDDFVTFNTHSLTAITTESLGDDEEDGERELVLECSLKDISNVSIEETSTYPKEVRIHLTTAPTLDSVQIRLSTQKGVCRTHHITLTVDSIQEKVLNKVLRARDIDYALQAPSIFRGEEEQEPEASLPTPKKTPKAPFTFSRPSAPLEHITNYSDYYDMGTAQNSDDIAAVFRTPPRIHSDESVYTDRPLLFDERSAGSTDRTRTTNFAEDHFGKQATQRDADRGAARGVKRSEAPTLQLFGGGRDAKKLKEKVVTFSASATSANTKINGRENESVRMLAPDSDSIDNSYRVKPSALLRQKKDGNANLSTILTNQSVALEQEMAQVNSDEEMILSQVMNATKGMSKKDRKAYLERELKAYETVDDSDEAVDQEVMDDGMEVELEVDGGGDLFGDMEEIMVDPAELAKASVAAPLFRFVPTTSQSAPILNIRKVPAPVAAGRSSTASMRHSNKAQEGRQEPSNAMDVDQDLANALQDLSSIVIHKLSLRRENVRKAFDAKLYFIEAAAREIGEKFYLETENFLRSVDDTLGHDAVKQDCKARINLLSDKGWKQIRALKVGVN